jgi:ribosomal protein S18 acetylase RimI-like enzyme
MEAPIQYKTGTATQKEIESHLQSCNASFVPPLDQTVNIAVYSEKLFAKAVCFEAWYDQKLVGFIAAYFNDVPRGFITNVSVLDVFKGKGISSKLLSTCINYAKARHFSEIALEVNGGNTKALNLYKKFSFFEVDKKDNNIFMKLELDTIAK